MDILAPPARAVLERYFLTGPGRETFYLGGGTALALADFRHRRSDDLDFFAREEKAVLLFAASIPDWGRTAGFVVEEDVTRRADRFRRFFLERADGRVKIEMIADSPPFFGPVRVSEKIRFEDRRTLFASKLGALAGRREDRDIVDAYFIFRHSGEDRVGLMRDAMDKTVGLDPLDIAVRLIEFDPGPTLPSFLARYMIRDVSVEELKEFCREQAEFIRGISW